MSVYRCLSSDADHVWRYVPVETIDETCHTYRQDSNLSRILVGNKLVDHSDLAGASPVGAAPTTSSLST